MFVHLGAFSATVDGHGCRSTSSLLTLRLPLIDLSDKSRVKHFGDRVRTTLKAMEARREQYRLPALLHANLEMLAGSLSLDVTERSILALAVLLRANDKMFEVAGCTSDSNNPIHQLAIMLGSTRPAVTKALRPSGSLLRSGLIDASSGNDLSKNLTLARGSTRRLAFQRLRGADDLFGDLLRAGKKTSLTLADYAHLSPSAVMVREILGDALDTERKGVNVLLYGAPGTGKTELARVLAAATSAKLFEVSSIDADGDPVDPKGRLGAAMTGQMLLARSRSILVFDEIDAIFNDGSELFGKPTTAESSKAWVNDLLEGNAVPIVWIANRIWNMDPAFVRRFDLVIKVDPMPLARRQQLIEKECGSLLGPGQAQRLACADRATPAVIARAANVVSRLRTAPENTGQLIESVIDGVLTAQGHEPVRRACRDALPTGYDVSFCNADTDLVQLASGLRQQASGRLCLYGPPGTGKTAFGQWLARALDRPLLLKRISDIQSPWLGEMERNLAQAFDQATRDGAVLQIDEVDTYLQDRRHAHRSWEISQVNEFLTQLESFNGIFIASTNLMDGLDPAAMRRFDYKVRVDYLRPEQIRSMLVAQLAAFDILAVDAEIEHALRGLDRLTPGDFAVLSRRHRIATYLSVADVAAALRDAQRMKDSHSRRIGFI